VAENTQNHERVCLLGGLNDGRPYLRGQNSLKQLNVELRHRRMTSMTPLVCFVVSASYNLQGRLKKRGHCLTACNFINVDQIHTEFGRDRGNFIVNVKSIYLNQLLENKMTPSNVFFYCITN